MADGGFTATSLFRPGVNCWRTARAGRAAPLIDGDDYFRAFAAAAQQARHSILILSWDFNSRTRLWCANGKSDEVDEPPEVVGEFLNRLCRQRRGLEVRILIWDYPMIFGTDREFPSVYGLGWKPHRRVHVRYDNTHPVTGSHHQKVVVIDDSIAFCGGLDLTFKRWDTHDHAPGDKRRCDGQVNYPPFHDVMLMVDGSAARSLGDLARERWRRATGRRLAPSAGRTQAWPRDVEPLFERVDVAIARTQPATELTEAVREVENLYLDMIAQARHTIYIENQYLTAQRVGAALEARLAEPDGPEVVIVLRLLSHGWLEEVTMQNLRKALIARLRKADVHGRLQVCYPHIDGLAEGTCIDIHSKVMIVDDQWLRIGSANISNRSMGFDTECDLAIEARGRDDVEEGIRQCRDQLLAEHLGKPREEVGATVEKLGSVSAAIDALHSESGRTLKRLDHEPEASDAVMTLASLADPEQAVDIDDLVDQFAPRSELKRGTQFWSKVLACIAVIGALTALWRFTPLAEITSPAHVAQWARSVADAPWAPLVVIFAFVPASIVFFPRPLITLFAVVAFGPWLGFTYAMTGILLAALLSYLVGTRLDRSHVRMVSGPQLERIIKVLRQRGLVAVTALRLVPLAPFAAEGIIAGAIRIRLFDFVMGTFLGMLPGTLAATVFGDQLHSGLSQGEVNFWLIGGIMLFLVVASLAVRRWLLNTELQGPDAGRR